MTPQARELNSGWENFSPVFLMDAFFICVYFGKRQNRYHPKNSYSLPSPHRSQAHQDFSRPSAFARIAATFMQPNTASPKPRPEHSLLQDESVRLFGAETVLAGFVLCCLFYAVCRFNGFL